MPLMYGTEAYTLFSLRDSSDSLVLDSVFGIVANLYMEHFESRALDTAPTPPTM